MVKLSGGLQTAETETWQKVELYVRLQKGSIPLNPIKFNSGVLLLNAILQQLIHMMQQLQLMQIFSNIFRPLTL